MKKVILFSLIFCLIFVFGCSSNTKPEPANNQTPPPQQTQTFKVGDKIKLGDYYLTVNGFEDYVDENPFIQPEEGNKFFIVDVTIENNGAEPKSYNELDFEIQDSVSYIYDSYLSLKEPSLQSGDLQPGRNVRGWITFEIPKNAQGLELIYQPDWWDAGQIIVKLE